MTDTSQVHIPPVAQMPQPKHGVRGGYQAAEGGEKPLPPTIGSGVESPNGEDQNAIEENVVKQAALMISRAKQERETLQTNLTEAILAIASRKREVEAMVLEREELKNNLLAMSAQCDELKQEASDLRTFFSSIKAQMDHFEIPLPVRKKIKRHGG